MELLVILILVGHEVSGGSTVIPKAEKIKTEGIAPFNNNTQNGKTEQEKEIIDKRQVYLPIDEIPKQGLLVMSEELFERPKRERETDKDFMKNVIREILSHDQFKHLMLRDRNDKKKGLHFGIQIGYNEKESASATHEKVPVDSVSEELNDGVRSALPKPRKRLKIYQKHYVLGRSKGVLKQADQEKDTPNFDSSKNDAIDFSKHLKKYEKNNQNVEKGLSNMAMALEKYLEHSKIDENDKNLGNSKGSPINNEADMSKQNIIVKAEVSKYLVNHILSEIKLLLASHKDTSQLYVSRILDIITKKQEFLSSHSDQACGEVKKNYLIHSLNTVYENYLKNAVCEGEYLDTGLDLMGWISSNKKYKKAKRKSNLTKNEIDSNDENETNNASKENRHESSSDSSGEVRMSDGSENERKNKIKHVKSLLTRDDSANIMTKEFESDEDHQDPNKENLELYIKSHLIKVLPLRSTIFHRSQPYYRNIDKLFTKQDNANIVLEYIHLVCEKIASEQFLHSVESIIWKLLKNRDCKPKNATKDENYSLNVLKPLSIDTNKHQIEQTKSADYSQESSKHDTADLNDSSNLSDENSPTHNTEFDESSQDHEDYDNVVPSLNINLRSKHKRFQDLTHLRNDKFKNIFLGSGKINSLKVIKQKLRNLNINDYKKLMENLPVAEKLLKVIYNKLPPQLQMVLTVLKTGATEIIGDKKFSLKKVPSLLIQIFSKGKGKDLLKMMADKFEHEKFKTVGKPAEKFQDKTRLRDIVQSVSEFEDNKKNDSNMVVNKDNLQEKPEPSQLDLLPHIELPSSIEKKDQPVIELTYVFNHPPAIHYKPKMFIKHNITYSQYVKNIKSIYNNDLVSSGNQIQLVRVIKKEGNDSQVFYETDIPNAAVEASNKSSLLDLYNQFYNSAKDKDKNSIEKLNKNYVINKNTINEITKSIPAVEFHSTFSPVSPVVSSKETTEFHTRDVKLDTVDSTSKNNENPTKRNDPKSEEVFFDNARSAELNNMRNTKLQSNSYDTEGIIQWNNYPINRPKYKNRRKISRNHPEIRRPGN